MCFFNSGADHPLDRLVTLIEKHRQNGDRLLIITATNRFITQPIANELGIPEMLASEPEVIDGEYTVPQEASA